MSVNTTDVRYARAKTIVAAYQKGGIYQAKNAMTNGNQDTELLFEYTAHLQTELEKAPTVTSAKAVSGDTPVLDSDLQQSLAEAEAIIEAGEHADLYTLLKDSKARNKKTLESLASATELVTKLQAENHQLTVDLSQERADTNHPAQQSNDKNLVDATMLLASVETTLSEVKALLTAPTSSIYKAPNQLKAVPDLVLEPPTSPQPAATKVTHVVTPKVAATKSNGTWLTTPQAFVILGGEPKDGSPIKATIDGVQVAYKTFRQYKPHQFEAAGFKTDGAAKANGEPWLQKV